MKIIINGKPKGKGRPRFYRGHAVTPKPTREYEQLIKSMWVNSMLDGEIKVKIDIFYPLDSKANKAQKELMLANTVRPKKKPDVDNVIKIVLDALNGVAYNDDAQVIEVIANKYYSDKPRLEIEVEN